MHLAQFTSPVSKQNLIILLDKLELPYQLQIEDGFSLVGPSNFDFFKPNTVSFYQGEGEAVFDKLKLFIVRRRIDMGDGNFIFVEDPKEFFIKLMSLCKELGLFESIPKAFVTSNESANTNIHPSAIIEDGVFVGNNSIISAGCVLKTGTFIGKNCIVRENTVIGVDGISPYKTKSGEMLKFPHMAGVLVHDDVEIGANCVLSKGTISYTEIGKETIIGNLCNVGHSSIIGSNVWMSVGTLVGGYSQIHPDATIGLGVSIKNGLDIGIDCSIGMGSVVVKSVEENKSCFGNPAKLVRNIQAGPER